MAPAAPIARPSEPGCSESQAKKGWPSSRSMAWASERTWEACSDQLSDSWRAREARSWNERMRVRLADRLSSRLASSLSPVCVEYLLEASDTCDQVSVTPCWRSYSFIRFQASDSMVWPRHITEPSAPALTTKSQPPPTRAWPVSTAAWFFAIPPISASFSTWESSCCAWLLSLSVTPRPKASPVETSRE